jgi:hypothetical protein
VRLLRPTVVFYESGIRVTGLEFMVVGVDFG